MVVATRSTAGVMMKFLVGVILDTRSGQTFQSISAALPSIAFRHIAHIKCEFVAFKSSNSRDAATNEIFNQKVRFF